MMMTLLRGSVVALAGDRHACMKMLLVHVPCLVRHIVGAATDGLICLKWKKQEASGVLFILCDVKLLMICL
jgi:hypothetical protein